VQIFVVNDRLNQMLIERLDPAIWKATPPGKVRPIAAIFAHVHNVRCRWIRLSAPHLKVPLQLNRAHCTPSQASRALAQSAARCAEMLAQALDAGEGRVEKFLRDGWARPWPVGPEMLCYMISHEAHHRGQVCMLSAAEQDDVRNVELGKAVEGMRRSAAPAMILKANYKVVGGRRVDRRSSLRG
jgi:uncharacterized damage-inducible protein DinB